MLRKVLIVVAIVLVVFGIVAAILGAQPPIPADTPIAYSEAHARTADGKTVLNVTWWQKTEKGSPPELKFFTLSMTKVVVDSTLDPGKMMWDKRQGVLVFNPHSIRQGLETGRQSDHTDGL